MRLNASPDSPIRILSNGTYILSGVVRVNVNHGQLVLKAGVFDNQDTLTVSKGSARMTRLAILGHSGSITFDALRWLNDIKVGLIQIDYDAAVILASVSPGPNIVDLRRAQAVARDTPQGLEMVRTLIIQKAIGQLSIYKRLGKTREYVLKRIDDLIGQLETAESLAQIRAIESQIAGIYWSRWATVPVEFERKDNARTPDEWKIFGTRLSPLSGSPRKACRPANAILNYLYALLEAEARIACLTMGLDPSMGILHADQPYRASMAYDLMEPARYQVDSWVLDLIRNRCFAKGDFTERASGQVMITKHLAHELIRTLPIWAEIIAPIVENAASHLSAKSMPRRLTHGNRYQSQKSARKVKKGRGKKKEKSKDGGEILPFIQAGPATLKRMRSEKIDPAHGGKAGKKRGRSNRARSKERKAWESSHTPDDKDRELIRFKNEILPAIAECSVTQIAQTTGFSPRYASLIRSGKVVPHPVHNAKLIKLINPAE